MFNGVPLKKPNKTCFPSSPGVSFGFVSPSAAAPQRLAARRVEPSEAPSPGRLGSALQLSVLIVGAGPAGAPAGRAFPNGRWCYHQIAPVVIHFNGIFSINTIVFGGSSPSLWNPPFESWDIFGLWLDVIYLWDNLWDIYIYIWWRMDMMLIYAHDIQW